jgi:hypothetical protein
MSIKLELINGDYAWVSLPKAYWVGKEELATGVCMRALYRGERSGRMVLETYNQWQDYRTQQQIGTGYRQLTRSEWIHYCDLAGVDPRLDPEDL